MLRKVPCTLLMLFGTLPLSVGDTSHLQSVLTVSSPADFESAFSFVMRHEDPGLNGIITVDQGGRTRFGVSEKAHPEAWKNGPPSFDDALKLAQVEFWDRHRLRLTGRSPRISCELCHIIESSFTSISLTKTESTQDGFLFGCNERQMGCRSHKHDACLPITPSVLKLLMFGGLDC
ncbi:MAG: hypothetical protein DMG23_08815 [Acidobacteria bacterium]|nr:MAG: hypothetical protein DMG23_08815 [Acidobacteriota bacterium]